MKQLDPQQQLAHDHEISCAVFGTLDGQGLPHVLLIPLGSTSTLEETLKVQSSVYRYCGVIAYLPNGTAKAAPEPDAYAHFIVVYAAIVDFATWVSERIAGMDTLDRMWYLPDLRAN